MGMVLGFPCSESFSGAERETKTGKRREREGRGGEGKGGKKRREERRGEVEKGCPVVQASLQLGR